MEVTYGTVFSTAVIVFATVTSTITSTITGQDSWPPTVYDATSRYERAPIYEAAPRFVEFFPEQVSVVEQDGWLRPLFVPAEAPEGTHTTARQAAKVGLPRIVAKV